MQEIIDEALNVAQLKGCSYADVRVEEQQTEELAVKDGHPDVITIGDSFGFGVRVVVDGCWGFAASSILTRAEAARVADQAVAIARASALIQNRRVQLSPVQPVQAEYRTPCLIDPFSVSLQDKLDLLVRSCQAMQANKAITVSEAFMGNRKQHKTFASTEGTRIRQEIVMTGAGIMATAVSTGEVQVRSYPNSARGNYRTAGYENITSMRLVDEAPRVAAEAEELLSAPVCPTGLATVVLEGSQLALQVHESIGHPIELDRVLGMEASFAGTSFLVPETLNTLQYGSRLINVTADATARGGLGTFAYDDEGVPAQATPIIREGRFVGYISSRETAPALDMVSSGAMRADSWNHIPLIRMTNINLEPGEGSLADLLADSDGGLFLATNKSWSIDDKRVNFQFATEAAWQIRGGKLGRIYKNPTYAGMTTQFWNSCDAVCGPEEWVMWGTPNCGKGEPMQVMYVGHGTSPARFRDVNVTGVHR